MINCLKSRYSVFRPAMKPNGPLVWAESVGGAVPPFTCPGFALRSVFHVKEGGGKLSRRASRHGAVFAPSRAAGVGGGLSCQQLY